MLNNMEQLQDKLNEYNSIGLGRLDEKKNDYMNIRSSKLQMYFQYIVPIIQDDKDNLETVLEILSNMN